MGNVELLLLSYSFLSTSAVIAGWWHFRKRISGQRLIQESEVAALRSHIDRDAVRSAEQTAAHSSAVSSLREHNRHLVKRNAKLARRSASQEMWNKKLAKGLNSTSFRLEAITAVADKREAQLREVIGRLSATEGECETQTEWAKYCYAEMCVERATSEKMEVERIREQASEVKGKVVETIVTHTLLSLI
jgi:hypothetical protein